MLRRGVSSAEILGRCSGAGKVVLHALMLLATVGVALAEEPPAALEIIRQSVSRDQMNWEKARDYTFIEREETNFYGKQGNVKKSESDTYEVLIIERIPFRRKIAHNDEPLEGKRKEKAQREFEKEVRKKLGKSEKERRKKAVEYEKERKKAREFMQEIPKAFTFELAGEETIEGRPAWIIDAEPHPGFKPTTKEAKFLPKFRGRLWIDQQDYQWVKVEAESIDTIGLGWVVARLGKGAKVTLQNRRVNDEIWLPEQISFRGAIRLMLLAKLNGEIRVDYSDYQKFQADSRIVATDVVE